MNKCKKCDRTLRAWNSLFCIQCLNKIDIHGPFLFVTYGRKKKGAKSILVKSKRKKKQKKKVIPPMVKLVERKNLLKKSIDIF